jgi:hypothetical protein
MPLLPPKSPPNPGARRPSRSLPNVVEENVAAGPHTHPPPSFHERQTLPPEENLPRAEPLKRTKTLPGAPAPPSVPPLADIEDEEEDSLARSIDGLTRLISEKNSELEKLTAEKEEVDGPSEREVSRASLMQLMYKFLGALTLFFSTVSLFLSVSAKLLEPKVDSIEAKQDPQTKELQAVRADVREIQAYLRAKAVIDECKESHTRSAINRGTGYDLTTLSDKTVVHWSSEGSPKTRMTWWPVEQCIAPGATPPKPPGAPPGE